VDERTRGRKGRLVPGQGLSGTSGGGEQPADVPVGFDSQVAEKRKFPCGKCGAGLVFAPGTKQLQCPYCSAMNEISLEEQTVEELDYEATLRELANAAPNMTVPVVRCDGCGAQVEVPEKTVSFACPFCTQPIVTQARACTVVRPNGILPFQLDKSKTIAAFRSWISSRWFAPNRLKRESTIDQCISGLYIPAWTYDTFTTSRYQGERGDAYYVSVRVGNNTQMQRRIRWSSRTGVVGVAFDDVLVEATTSLSSKELESLQPWDLKGMVPYDDRFLAGFRAECYQVDLPMGFKRAKQLMVPRIHQAIRRDIGGDEQRIHHVSTTYQGITFKHFLMPVWVSAYRYHNKVYRFLVNARTGEVFGERPYSAWKISFAVLAGLVVIGIIILIAYRK
jgi:DNA-directed RNA polymerase subunit RPC12/RpoP